MIRRWGGGDPGNVFRRVEVGSVRAKEESEEVGVESIFISIIIHHLGRRLAYSWRTYDLDMVGDHATDRSRGRRVIDGGSRSRIADMDLVTERRTSCARGTS